MNAPFSYEAGQVVLQTLGIMAEGMGGIFVFMALIYGLIKALMKWAPKAGEPPKAETPR